MTNVDGRHCPASSDCCPQSIGFTVRFRRNTQKVAIELEAILRQKKKEIDDWRAKEQMRDEMLQAIRDFLYSDVTGLPGSYDEPEIEAKAEAVFAHTYPGLAAAVS